MQTSPGTRIGPYVVVGPLGAGGMGEVWRARDSRLGRDVAIKALPAACAADPERLARFEREAKLLASLNHPNVAGIHGVEEVDGARYLVLELVEGESLAARLARGPLPVDEARDVCRQIAAGVEAAHEAGVVHRDLKPGNVMLRTDGTAKVLDFGLARGVDDGVARNPAESPTMTAAPATTAGAILGTAAYMSPEQARGRVVDKRSDVWSFGCVLYECLAGRQAFGGESLSDTLAAILRSDPDLSALPMETPAHVRDLCARCLCKDPRERLRDIGEARILLGAPHAARPTDRAGAPSRVRRVPLWAAVAAALALAALAASLTFLARPKAAAPVRKLDLVTHDIAMDWFFAPMLSPDGGRIAYVANDRLFVRDLSQLDALAVTKIEGISPLCWSQDSRTLYFNDRGKLWRVSSAGGTPTAICEVPGTGDVTGIAASRDGALAFASWRGGIYRVPAEGGVPALLVDIDPSEMVDFHAPSWLPNGDLMHVVHWKTDTSEAGGARPVLAVFSGGKRIPIEGDFGGMNGAPTLTASGLLLFTRRDSGSGIWAVPYDVAGRRTTGTARLVAPGAASISVANDGSLLYLEGNDRFGQNEMVWVDRTGRVVETAGPPHPGLWDAALSPDGRRIAFTAMQSGSEDIFVRDLARGTDTRITFGPARETDPRWLGPSRLSFAEADGSAHRTLAVNADGSGGLTVLASARGAEPQEACVAPDGRTAARIIDRGRLTISDVLPDGSFGPPRPLLRSGASPVVDAITISRDGRLLACATDDPGLPEVFVTRYPGGEGYWQVSAGGGRSPRWSNGTSELLFIGGGGPSRRSMITVAIDAEQDPPVGAATRLFSLDPRWLRAGEMPFDISHDGQRFLMVREAAGAGPSGSRLVLVQNWEAEFAAR